MKEAELEWEAPNVLLALLQEVPFLSDPKLTREPSVSGRQADFTVEVLVQGELWTLLAEVKGNAYPRLVREAVARLSVFRETLPRLYVVFMAPFISRDSARILREAGMGYADLAGNCFLSFAGVYIRVEGRANPFRRKQQLRDPFAPKAARVLRVLLQNPGKSWKPSALADEAGTSPGQVYNLRKLLLDLEWIRLEKKGIVLTDPESLLRGWADSYRPDLNRREDFYSTMTIPEIEESLADACRRLGIKYALTSFSGAERIAPYAKYQRVSAFVHSDIEPPYSPVVRPKFRELFPVAYIERVAEVSGLRRVSSGANVSLLIPYDEGVFYGSSETRGIAVVSPIQLYLDLRAAGGKGEDAAEFLFKEAIKPKW